ncbi:MAG: N-acetylneuraminate synthase family protein, partial [SAR202 cluster bacterium]|nr:N-acetylneuraminate synthase family protein [SAR202 cluster bacterium]
MVNPFIEIEGIKIGENYPPLIIPEIGINHGGKLETAIKMVDSAKKAGAKIIKHQTHIPDDEMSEEAKKVKPGNSSSDIYSIINKCSLSEENEFKLYAYVKSKKMIFLSTPFSKKAVDRLIKFKVNAFKIGSGEFNNLPLLKYVCKFKKPLILSTGMHDIKSVKLINSYLSRLGVKYAFLHTTSLYPTPDHLVRLNAITELKKNFPK